MRRLAPLGTVLALALAATACGGGKSSKGTAASGADRVPASAAAFVAVDSDPSSDQWRAAQKLADKFPGKDDAVRELKRSLREESGLDYEDDVRPALGNEVDFVWLDFAAQGSDYVVLTKPNDARKFKALVEKANEKSEEKFQYRERDGWFELAKSTDTLDLFDQHAGDSKLSGDSEFKAAMDALPETALVKAYVDGEALAGVLRPALGKSALDQLEFAAAALAAEDAGVRLTGAARGAGPLLGGKPYASKLLPGVPNNALAFLDFRGGSARDELDRVRGNPRLHEGLRAFEQMLGLPLEDVVGLFEHEVAFFVRQGAPLPEFDLALEEPDLQKALAQLDRLAERVARIAHGKLTQSRDGDLEVRTLELPKFAIHYAGFDGKVLLTTGATGLRDYQAGGAKLADDPDFREAKKAAGAPDETNGLVYVNLKDAIALVEGFLSLSGNNPPAEVTDNLRPLRSLLAYGATKGDLSTFTAFLEIK